MDYWIERGTHFFAVAWDEIARALGGRCEHREVAWIADAGSPHAFLNGAILERPLREDEAEQLTEHLDAFFGAGDGGPWLLWSGGPTPDLSRFGYVERGHPMAMIRPPGGEIPPAPAGLRIVEARDIDTLVDVERTIVEGYPLAELETQPPGSLFPASLLGGPFRFWVGYFDERPAAAAVAVLHADATHVLFVATRPELRGRGYGEAVTWRATLVQPHLTALLQASRLGRPIYERMGYGAIGAMTIWQRPRLTIGSMAPVQA
jgi:ribosomal protein S18 acetylase RimI-like enzyme